MMHKLLPFVTLLLLLGWSPLQMANGEKNEHAEIQVDVTTTYGEPIDSAKIELISSGENKDYGKYFVRHKASAIPFGEYSLGVWAPGFRKRVQELRVYQNRVSTHIALAVHGEGDLPCRLSGTLLSTPRDSKATWVKLVSIYDSLSIDTKLDSAGKFQLTGVDSGDYLLVTIQGTRVLDTRIVRVCATKEVVIDVSRNSK